MSLSPLSRTFTTPVSPAKPSALQVIPPTRHTTSSVCYHQGGDWGVSKPGLTDWKTASSTRLSGSWTPSRPCPPPLSYPMNHWTRSPTPPPPPPTHSHSLTLTLTHTHTHTHTHSHTHTHTHTHTHWDKHRSLVQHCTLLVTLNSLDKLFALHLHSTLFVCLFVCLFHWFALSAMCHMPLYPFFILFLFSLFNVLLFSYMSLFVYL